MCSKGDNYVNLLSKSTIPIYTTNKNVADNSLFIKRGLLTSNGYK